MEKDEMLSGGESPNCCIEFAIKNSGFHVLDQLTDSRIF